MGSFLEPRALETIDNVFNTRPSVTALHLANGEVGRVSDGIAIILLCHGNVVGRFHKWGCLHFGWQERRAENTTQ